ncbi:MAG: adenylosuccinate lyase family protein [Rhodobacteraceae bacterium]|jgi:3-carboxy-cis,cis-muconate cycloisomerase|nr:adenylosuccinate lyase family protein [Paracoccaceae bacterium]
MAGSVFDSPLHAKLFPAGDMGRLFTDTAEVRAMMLVEGSLAKVQGTLGIIPEISAAAIHRASLELQIDPSGLGTATGQNGVSIPGLVAEFRKLMQAPEHAQYLHFGATSQDITDTALMLRVRQLLALQENGLKTLVRDLATLARDHATTPMVARTYGQSATLTSFGATVAVWGHMLADLMDALPALRDDVLWVSLSGAAGTGSVLGPNPDEVRQHLAAAVGLRDPKRSWHADRGPILRLAAWQTQLAAALGKIAQDVWIMTQSGMKTVTLGAKGGSSTMPQKENPVQPSAIIALANMASGLNATLTQAAQHREARDGAAWFTEWMALPQLCLTAGSALTISGTMIEGLAPNTDAMAVQIAETHDMIMAEAVTFALAKTMPRPDAAALLKEAVQLAMSQGTGLLKVVQSRFPDLDMTQFEPQHQLGAAPNLARGFADRVDA